MPNLSRSCPAPTYIQATVGLTNRPAVQGRLACCYNIIEPILRFDSLLAYCVHCRHCRQQSVSFVGLCPPSLQLSLVVQHSTEGAAEQLVLVSRSQLNLSSMVLQETVNGCMSQYLCVDSVILVLLLLQHILVVFTCLFNESFFTKLWQ